MIDWKRTQARLAPDYGGRIDGIPGPKTYAALYAGAAQISVTRPEIVLRGKVAADRFADFGMTTAPRIAEFIAQCCHETGGFCLFEENLDYRAETLLRQWPTHFTPDQARAAVGKPIEIASRAYGGRMGNAPYPSDEGYRYRGRYDLQLTGKDNYRRFGDLLGIDLLTDPDAAPPEASPLVALTFFKLGEVNAAVDAGDFARARHITNGGAIGLAEVAGIRVRLLDALA